MTDLTDLTHFGLSVAESRTKQIRELYLLTNTYGKQFIMVVIITVKVVPY